MNCETVVATIAIGNSDDRLLQAEWASFISDCRVAVSKYGTAVFDGGTGASDIRQSYCWILINVSRQSITELHEKLSHLAKQYRQDSIALVTGESILVSSNASIKL